MNPAHLHLLLNHFPVVGTVLGIFLLIMNFIFPSRSLHKTTCYFFVLVAVFSVATYLSGEPAKEKLLNSVEISDNFISNHETLAFYAMLMTIFIGIVALAISILKIRSPLATATLLVLCLINTYILVVTGNLGGEIRHIEIRNTPGLENAYPTEEQE